MHAQVGLQAQQPHLAAAVVAGGAAGPLAAVEAVRQPQLSSAWQQHPVLLMEPVNFRKALDIKRACNPTEESAISPSISAPASFHVLIADGLSVKATPTSSSIVSALSSIISIASSDSTSKFGMFLSINLALSILTAVLSARRALPPPLLDQRLPLCPFEHDDLFFLLPVCLQQRVSFVA